MYHKYISAHVEHFLIKKKLVKFHAVLPSTNYICKLTAFSRLCSYICEVSGSRTVKKSLNGALVYKLSTTGFSHELMDTTNYCVVPIANIQSAIVSHCHSFYCLSVKAALGTTPECSFISDAPRIINWTGTSGKQKKILTKTKPIFAWHNTNWISHGTVVATVKFYFCGFIYIFLVNVLWVHYTS